MTGRPGVHVHGRSPLRTKEKRLERINEALEGVEREAGEQAAEGGKDPAEARVADKAQ